jgi:hypothetical protein
VDDAFSGRAQAVHLVLIDEAVGSMWGSWRESAGRVDFTFPPTAGKIVAIDLFSDPELVRWLEATIPGYEPEGEHS